jgi:ABC-type proline/glycine betaine transport system substrate-binding protein
MRLLRACALALLLVGWGIPGVSPSPPFLRECDPQEKREAQPFQLPSLKLQWDGWETSRIATSVAAILLSEKLGFTVQLVEGGNPSQVYTSLSQGRVHMAFESWPESNRAQFDRFAGPNATAADRIHAFPYADLFGHSGIFEACSRQSNGERYPTCNDKSILDSPALLQDVLETEEGRDFFAPLPSSDNSFPEWVPPYCEDKNCTVEIYHVDPDYDKGLIEGMVEALGLPAKVVYIGAGNMSRQVWSAYTKRAGALMYGYFPDINHYGISNLELPRSKIPPDLDLQRQQIQKLAWPGLVDHRGSDALAFVKEFALTKADYAELSELFDLFQDPQETACAWVKKNPSKWSKWISFPERERAPLICLPNFMSNGLCDVSYFMGWMAVLLQLGTTVAMFLLARFLNHPPERPDNYRERLDEKLVVSGAARYVAAWWRQRQEKRRLKKQVRAVGKLGPLIHNTSLRGNGTPPSGRRRSKTQALEALMQQAKAYAAQTYNTKMARKDFLRATRNADVKAGEVNAELHKDTHSWWYAWSLRWTGNFKTRVDFTSALYNVPVVLSHIRKYDNFARANQDPKVIMPPDGGDDRWIGDLSRGTLFTYMLFTTTDGVLPVILQCIGLGFFSGAVSTVFYQLVRHETYMVDHTAWAQGESVAVGRFFLSSGRISDSWRRFSISDVPTRTERSYLNAIEGIGTRAGSLVAAYAFFPTFLQVRMRAVNPKVSSKRG